MFNWCHWLCRVYLLDNAATVHRVRSFGATSVLRCPARFVPDVRVETQTVKAKTVVHRCTKHLENPSESVNTPRRQRLKRDNAGGMPGAEHLRDSQVLVDLLKAILLA